MSRDTRLSRRQFLALSGGAAAAVALTACTSSSDESGPIATIDVGTPKLPTPIPSSGANPSPTTAPPTLETKIGQMLMVGFRGLTVDRADPIGSAIALGRLGHVVLFDVDPSNAYGVRNVEGPTQLATLTRALQELAPETMLIATDEEGGQVARLDERHGFPATVSEQFLGDQDDIALTARHAAELARTLANAGVTLNLAPVVDLNVNPQNPVIGALGRSFSADAGTVARQARAFIDAHHEHDVLCTLKHFPGHGSSTADSHLGFVDVTNTWTRAELEPFRDLVAANIVDAIMTAHIFNGTLDPTYPATLSRPIITGILREELGWDGVVLTDDMQMRAIRDYYGFEEAIELAINAGADIISIANMTVYEPDAHVRAFDAIMNAVHAGRIAPTRIDESYRRITALTDRLQPT